MEPMSIPAVIIFNLIFHKPIFRFLFSIDIGDILKLLSYSDDFRISNTLLAKQQIHSPLELIFFLIEILRLKYVCRRWPEHPLCRPRQALKTSIVPGWWSKTTTLFPSTRFANVPNLFVEPTSTRIISSIFLLSTSFQRWWEATFPIFVNKIPQILFNWAGKEEKGIRIKFAYRNHSS